MAGKNLLFFSWHVDLTGSWNLKLARLMLAMLVGVRIRGIKGYRLPKNSRL